MLKQLIEKLEKLTNSKVILESKTIKPWEIQPGDIFEIPKHGQFVALTHGQKGRTLTKVNVVPLNKVDEFIKAGERGRGTIGITSRPTATYTVVGKLAPKKLQALQAIERGEMVQQAAVATKNFKQADFDGARQEWYINLANGKKAFTGDKVMIKFDNGNFEGILKATGGNKDHKVTVVVGNREKGRTLNPERIIDVITPGVGVPPARPRAKSKNYWR